LIVAKIGGSCLRTKSDVRNITEILKRIQQKPILVVSAFKGVTDELVTQAKNVLQGEFDIGKISDMHYDLVRGLMLDRRIQAEEQVKALLEELRGFLQTIHMQKCLNPGDIDRVLSYGEKLASKIIAAYLNELGVDARPLWDNDAGIVTDSNFGNASILGTSIPLIREKLCVTYVPVIAGFFGVDEKGRITTFGRGGSDYTATFIAAALHCEVVLFKDVPGLMTADPKIVKNASTIRRIRYQEALELASHGSKVIFEKAVVPAMNASIPIRITAFHKPTTGTIISDRGEALAVSSLPRIVILSLTRSYGFSNIQSKLISKLKAANIYPILAQTTDQVFMIVVRESDSEAAQTVIRKTDENTRIEKNNRLGLVAVVGNKSRKKGSAFVFRHLSGTSIAVNALVQNHGSLNVIVNREDVAKTTQALHDFFLGSNDLAGRN
jgi:aspartate kinase